jgi:hypothetical protein
VKAEARPVSQSTRRAYRGRIHRVTVWTAVIVGALAFLVSGGAAALAIPPGSTALAVAPPVPALPTLATVSLGAYVGSHHRSPFYAVTFDDNGLGPNAAADLGLYFNSTPFTWFRLGEGGIGYDPTTSTNWVAPAGGGRFVPVAEQMLNLTWFKAWCYSRTPHCRWIAALPGEENNTTAAVHFANYFHQVLNFPPTAWEFDNEPNAWTHYDENVTTWSTTDASTPTAIGYATMVKDYIAAIVPLYPSDHFIGIQSNCACGPALIETTVQLNGPNLFAVAYHSYPWANDSSALPSQFMGALESPRNLSSTASTMRGYLATACSTCTNLPIEVGEYNAGPVPDHSPLAMNYSGAVFMAASLVEALEANVSMFTEYSLGWLYNSTTAQPLPEGLLYQRFLDNLTMGRDYAVHLTAPGVGGLYGILIQAGTKESLLLVNTNITKAISVTLPTSLLASGLTGSTYSWDPRTPYPTVQSGILLPTTYTIWSQGILMINNY